MRAVFSLAKNVLLIIGLLASGQIAAEPGALQTCVACHGKNGVGLAPDYANLGGQHEAYLAIQLRAFRSGERKNVVMNGMAAQLSDSDIDELARYYAEQPWVTTDNGQSALVDEGLNRAGYCHACHGMQGHPVANEWPIIAGQSAPYIENQLMAFKSGSRYHPLMANVVKDLKPAAMTALAAYYTQLTKTD